MFLRPLHFTSCRGQDNISSSKRAVNNWKWTQKIQTYFPLFLPIVVKKIKWTLVRHPYVTNSLTSEGLIFKIAKDHCCISYSPFSVLNLESSLPLPEILKAGGKIWQKENKAIQIVAQEDKYMKSLAPLWALSAVTVSNIIIKILLGPKQNIQK